MVIRSSLRQTLSPTLNHPTNTHFFLDYLLSQNNRECDFSLPESMIYDQNIQILLFDTCAHNKTKYGNEKLQLLH